MRWTKKDPLGRPLHDWEQVTIDQLTPHARALVSKMARIAARDHFEEMREVFWEALRTDLGKDADARATLAVRRALRAQQDPGDVVGDCLLCGQPRLAGQDVIRAGSSWCHHNAHQCARPNAQNAQDAQDNARERAPEEGNAQ